MLGVTAGTVSQADVDEALARASAPTLRRRRPGGDAGVSFDPQPSPAKSVRHDRSIMGSEADRGALNDTGERDGGDIPVMDFIYRLYAPKKHLDRYEQLEREAASAQFKQYSKEDQEEVLRELLETQAFIEKRDNRLNALAAAVGGIYGAYTGTMATMLCSACTALRCCACA